HLGRYSLRDPQATRSRVHRARNDPFPLTGRRLRFLAFSSSWISLRWAEVAHQRVVCASHRGPIIGSSFGLHMPTINIQGRSFYYEELGRGEDALVFLSGLGADHRAFSRAQRHFGTRFRTISMDARDVGQSDRADGLYTTRDMARD